MPRSFPRPHLVILAVLVAIGAACASARPPEAELGPLSAEECAREALGMRRDGRSASATFDSSFAMAQKNERPPVPKPGDPKLDRPPAISNGAAIQGAMSRLYPPELLFTRRGGMAMMAVLIRADGSPDQVRVLRTSGFASLDAASVEVAKQLRFSPGIYRECPVWVFTLMPINWQPGPPPPPGMPQPPARP